jgi:hypothetical protein
VSCAFETARLRLGGSPPAGPAATCGQSRTRLERSVAAAGADVAGKSFARVQGVSPRVPRGMLRRTFLPLAASTIVLAACSDAPTGPDPRAVGGYALLSINAQPLPMRVGVAGPSSTDIVGGMMTIKADATYSLRIEVRTTVYETTQPGRVSTAPVWSFGSYTRRGSAYRFLDTQGKLVATGTVSGTEIVFIFTDGVTTYGFARV